MSYKIQYSPQDGKRYPGVDMKQKRKGRNLLFPIALLTLLVWFWLYGIPDFLIPGEPEITKAAAEEMVDRLHSGMKLEDALTAFCQDIIYDT